MKLGVRPVKGALNGRLFACAGGARAIAPLRREVDPRREEFFAPDFLDEPPLRP